MSEFIPIIEQKEVDFESPSVEVGKHHKVEVGSFKFDFSRYTVKRTALGAKKNGFK